MVPEPSPSHPNRLKTNALDFGEELDSVSRPHLVYNVRFDAQVASAKLAGQMHPGTVDPSRVAPVRSTIFKRCADPQYRDAADVFDFL